MQPQEPARPTNPSVFVRRVTHHDVDPGALEIDGEARHIDDGSSPMGTSEHAIGDDHDEFIVASLAERRLAVHPGGAVAFIVDLLNNGPRTALFRIHLEGWIDDEWLVDGPQHLQLRPGERTKVSIPIAPPRRAEARAGEHPVAVIVRSPDYPHHMARLGATLVVHSYLELSVGRLQPQAASVGWIRPHATFFLPITNLSNRTVTVQIYGQTHGCAFRFAAPESGQPQKGVAQFELASQQTLPVRIMVQPTAFPWFGVGAVRQPLTVAVGVLGEARLPRSATAELRVAPLVTMWHGAALALSLLVSVALMGMLLLASQLATRLSFSPQPADTASPAPPVVAIILNQSPSTSTSTQGAPAPPVSERTPLKTLPDGPVGGAQSPAAGQMPGLSVVQPGQVTAPGETWPRPAATHSGSGMTYAQMFQQVAMQFDLDWRILAAQAYVESGFDSLALGSRGDMGLMQVLPSTWREWAPAVGVNDPFDAYSNALVAAAYLDHVRSLLSQRGYTQAHWMLIAYNWGPDKLLDFLAAGGGWDQLPEARRKYATEIMNIARSIP